MKLLTQRLLITHFNLSMASSVCAMSLEKDNVRYMPDEVFETEEIALQVIKNLIRSYRTEEGPFVYPIFWKQTHIGHIELVKIQDDWEVGYHIGEQYQGNGYAAEALIGFLPFIRDHFHLSKVYGICVASNIASAKTLSHAGFQLLDEKESMYHGKTEKVRRYIYAF